MLKIKKSYKIDRLEIKLKKIVLVVLLSLFVITGCVSRNTVVRYDVATSKDSERISYNVYGKGEISLIFIQWVEVLLQKQHVLCPKKLWL